MRASSLRFRLVVLALAAGLPVAHAADSSSAEQQLRDQLRQTVLELRETQDENAALKARQATLTEQLATQTPPPPVRKADDKQLAALQRAVQQQTAQQQQYQQQLEQAQKLLAQWQQAYQQAAEVARGRDEAAKKYQALYEQSSSAGASCASKNAELMQIGNELLQRYENKGMWESLRDEEPFTQLHRVKLEKIAQDYHDKLVNDSLPVAAAEAKP
jgi:chromosome segregation ATPase